MMLSKGTTIFLVYVLGIDPLPPTYTQCRKICMHFMFVLWIIIIIYDYLFHDFYRVERNRKVNGENKLKLNIKPRISSRIKFWSIYVKIRGLYISPTRK